MTDDKQGRGDGPPRVDRPGARATAFNTAIATLGIAVVVFIIGVVIGFPLATFGVEFVTNNSGAVFGILFGFLVLVLLVGGTVAIFRKQIWGMLFKRGEVEMERFARPLAEVARFAALQKVAEATESARDLAELVLARYAWVSTRRWLMATITAFIAAIAALAGSALLFQQNQLLRTQIGLMQDQNARIEEQNRFIANQIELGEAQRSTAIVPEIIAIGALLADEVQRIDPTGTGLRSVTQLSPSTRARILSATSAARPYRYLRTPLMDLDENQIMSSGLLRRTDISASGVVRGQLEAVLGRSDQFTGALGGVMSDRPLSPERGQVITLLVNSGFTDLDAMGGPDFSFAEVRTSLQGVTLYRAMLRFADFEQQLLLLTQMDGAYLEHSRFRSATLDTISMSKSKIGNIDVPTNLAGADFSLARLKSVTFDGSRGFGISFDNAVLHKVTFVGTDIAASTFRGTIFGEVDFTGAGLKSVDFDGAIVFDPAFLDTIATQAAPESFVAERFTIAPLTPDEFSEHPRWSDAWLDGLEEQQAYRITRVGEFE
jgi:hypothetical protein